MVSKLYTAFARSSAAALFKFSVSKMRRLFRDSGKTLHINKKKNRYQGFEMHLFYLKRIVVQENKFSTFI